MQLGTQFRRSVYEKDGNEVTGGVVLMRHGENPLAVTERVKEKIHELQPGLPDGVHIVPAYDRTRLIHGAIHTLTEVMWHEMLIASIAILLILMHVRSVFVICVTLPLAVLFSFLMMWVLRAAGHHRHPGQHHVAGRNHDLDRHPGRSGDRDDRERHAPPEGALRRPAGDRRHSRAGDRSPAAPSAGRSSSPCMIMLLSFIPVFMLSGREGKLFHPLAFTKSFAMIGVALISVTLVPALIPTFIKGRLRSEEENWIVRSFIHIYKPLLTWALPRRNLVMWMFAVLLVLAAGMFPLQAVFGQGASETPGGSTFLLVFAVVTSLTVLLYARLAMASCCRWRASSVIGLWAYPLPQDRRRLHAGARRRHDARHAGHRAAGQRHAGGRRPESPRRLAARLSRSRIGHRQSRPGRHADRSGAARHGRDVRQLPAEGTVAEARACNTTMPQSRSRRVLGRS